MNSKSTVKKCSNCGNPLEADWNLCPVCGQLTSTRLKCPNCKSKVNTNWKFCPKCKTSLLGNVFISKDQGLEESMMGYRLSLPIEPDEVLAKRYKVIKSLGIGGFGEVYLVKDNIIKEEIALKIVVTGEEKDKRTTERIIHEFKLRERITDMRHIVRAWDPRLEEYKGMLLVLFPMEFADGGNLRQWLKNSPHFEKRIREGLEYFKQICLGVKAIHNAGLVHLDLKPENILFVGGRIKVSDFGFGRFMGQHFIENPSWVLRSGLGTLQYMSPEQFKVARQKDVKAWSDIYTLGVVLFEILDGDPPFDGTPEEIKQKHLEMAPPMIDNISVPLQAIVNRCLEKGQKKRFKNVSGLLSDLESQELLQSMEIRTKPRSKESDTVLIQQEHEKESTIETISKIKPWFWIHPNWKKSIEERIRDDGVFINKTFVSEVDANSLITAGCVEPLGYTFREGKPTLDLTIETLIACFRIKELNMWVESLEPKNAIHTPSIKNILHILSTESSSENVLREIERWYKSLSDEQKSEIDAEIIRVLLAVIIGDKEQTLQYVKEKEQNIESVDERLLFAKIYGLVFNDEQEALRFLADAENHAEEGQWVKCAETWMSVFKNESEARRCLEKAEECIDYSDYWRECSYTWKLLFDENKKSQQCLELAEKSIDGTSVFDINNWKKIAEGWEVLFNNRSKSELCLREAEKTLDIKSLDFMDINSWIICAEGWKDIFNDNHNARRCLEEAENKYGKTLNRMSYAEAWIDILGDTRNARRLLEEEEEDVEHVFQWVACAENWKEVLNNNRNAKRCLEKAENNSENSLDWVGCAEGWKNIFNDNQNAQRCLKKGEDNISDTLVSHDWVRCAEAWKNIFNDEKEVQRCMKEGEEEALITIEWVICAKAWKEEFKDNVKSRRCLQEAQDTASDSDDWNKCAEFWKELFENNREARRCLKEAEDVASNSDDWTHCAENWKDLFNNNREARRCLQEAEDIALDSLDWTFCADTWKELFEDNSAVRRCLKNAEDVASDADDWKDCAKAWERLLKDNQSASRCRREARDWE